MVQVAVQHRSLNRFGKLLLSSKASLRNGNEPICYFPGFVDGKMTGTHYNWWLKHRYRVDFPNPVTMTKKSVGSGWRIHGEPSELRTFTSATFFWKSSSYLSTLQWSSSTDPMGSMVLTLSVAGLMIPLHQCCAQGAWEAGDPATGGILNLSVSLYLSIYQCIYLIIYLWVYLSVYPLTI